MKKEVPDFLKDNLNLKFELRPYQIEAFARFFHCLDRKFPGKDWPLHFLFNMATGSGKTLIMAGLILYLYEKYRSKVIYRYDLRQFRNDGHSKDVYIVQADFEEKDPMDHISQKNIDYLYKRYEEWIKIHER